MAADREEVTFPSGDGSCVAWMYRPSGVERPPCVVMGNGFSLTRHDGLPVYAARFADAGFAVLLFDYRYFGDSPGSPRQRFRTRSQRQDWRSALAHARADRGIDSSRIVAWGYSFGGGHVTAVAARDHGLAAVMLLFPFVSGLRRVLKTPPGVSAWVMPRSIGDWLGRHNTIPVTGPAGSRAAMAFAGEQAGFERTVAHGSPWRNEISPAVFATVGFHRPVARARSIRCPLWVGIGARDITVDNEAAARLADRAPRGEAHRYPMDHFDALTPEGIERVAADQLEFLRRVA